MYTYEGKGAKVMMAMSGDWNNQPRSQEFRGKGGGGGMETGGHEVKKPNLIYKKYECLFEHKAIFYHRCQLCDNICLVFMLNK